MPDKPLTVLTYAASASLAAAALVYLFTPNYLLDGESSSSASMRKKGVVALSNPGNDCFINSILQALAGLRELRLYLVRELHRRKLDDAAIYDVLPPRSKDGKPVKARDLLSMQHAEVTQGLKDILDQLNEKPLQKKTISAANFIYTLERAYGTRISKAQQDAQELLQVVVDRVSDEYHAGRDARKRAREVHRSAPIPIRSASNAVHPDTSERSSAAEQEVERVLPLDGEATKVPVVIEEDQNGFPMQGRTESQIECQHCHFIPKSTPSPFVMLNLTVPQRNTATLNECFDSHFKTEYIDDYKCDRCRLQHAVETYQKDLKRDRSEKEQMILQRKVDKLEAALASDPERPPPDVELPSSKLAPARKIARHVRIVDFPDVLVVHLSRSIYDHHSVKNTARVSFPERLPLGGLLHRRNYRLLGVVAHKGTHHSGHYETFRRQHVYAPTSSTQHVGEERSNSSAGQPQRNSTPTPAGLHSPPPQRPPTAGSTSASASISTSISTATENGARSPETGASDTPASSTGSPPSLSTPPSSHSLVGGLAGKPAPPQLTTTPAHAPASDGAASSPPDSGAGAGTSASTNASTRDSHGANQSQSQSALERRRDSAGGSGGGSGTPRARSRVVEGAGRLRRAGTKSRNSAAAAAAAAGEDRWWRISDEKVKECRTADVLGMQKEAYILFYEIERE